jgi:GAF domain-containing protein
MSEEAAADNGDALARAQETIARLQGENSLLQRRLSAERFAEDVRQALTLASTTGTLAAPVSHSRLLEMIVGAAMQVISAAAGSLFLVDEEGRELIFEVALGGKAEEVRRFRVPLGHGIAGLVAVSGQAMAVSEAESDPRQATDIAEAVGYIPQSILCVPLFYNDEVIGVLELLDKQGAPAFSPEDIDILGLFAGLAAVAIEQSRAFQHLAPLLGAVLSADGAEPGSERLLDGARAYAATVEEDASYRQALELALLIQGIVRQGPNETQAVRAILEGFDRYLRLRPEAIDQGAPA